MNLEILKNRLTHFFGFFLFIMSNKLFFNYALNVIDMWLRIYVYGILSRNGNQNSIYSRILLKGTFSQQSWRIHNLTPYVWYFEIEMVIKISQIIPLGLKGTFSQRSYVEFESTHVVFWDWYGNQNTPQHSTIFQTIILNDTFSPRCYVGNESTYMIFWDWNGN